MNNTDPKHPHNCDCADFHRCGDDYYFWTCDLLWDCECDGADMFQTKPEGTSSEDRTCQRCDTNEDDGGMPDSHCHEAIDSGKCPKGFTTYTGPRYQEED